MGEPRLRHGGSKTGFQPLQCEEAPLRACGGSRHSCNNDNQLDDFGYHVRCDPGQRLQSESNVVDGNRFGADFTQAIQVALQGVDVKVISEHHHDLTDFVVVN